MNFQLTFHSNNLFTMPTFIWISSLCVLTCLPGDILVCKKYSNMCNDMLNHHCVCINAPEDNFYLRN